MICQKAFDLILADDTLYMKFKLNKDLKRISKGTTQCKINFNSDTTKCSHFIPPENTRKKRFSGDFGGFKMGTLARNGMKMPMLLGHLPKNNWELY